MNGHGTTDRPRTVRKIQDRAILSAKSYDKGDRMYLASKVERVGHEESVWRSKGREGFDRDLTGRIKTNSCRGCGWIIFAMQLGC